MKTEMRTLNYVIVFHVRSSEPVREPTTCSFSFFQNTHAHRNKCTHSIVARRNQGTHSQSRVHMPGAGWVSPRFSMFLLRSRNPPQLKPNLLFLWAGARGSHSNSSGNYNGSNDLLAILLGVYISSECFLACDYIHQRG